MYKLRTKTIKEVEFQAANTCDPSEPIAMEDLEEGLAYTRSITPAKIPAIFEHESSENTHAILTFKNLSVTTKTSPCKTLLSSVSGSISGGFWAIMGKKMHQPSLMQCNYSSFCRM